MEVNGHKIEPSADLSGADLSRANLINAKLESADLSGADLSRANLTNAKLESANLRGTNLPNEDLGSPSKSYTHWFDDQAGANSAVVIQNQIHGELSSAAWHTDPSGKFELRYWNGKEWTEHVVRESRQLADSSQPITQGNKSSEKETSTFWARLKNFFENYGGPFRERECPNCGSTDLIRIPISAPNGQGGWHGPQHAGPPAGGEHMVALLHECRNCGYSDY